MYGQKCAYMSTSARGNTDANSMWTDTHGLAGSEPTDVAHGIVALDVWDVAQER